MSVWRLSWRNAWRNLRRTGVVVTAVAVGIAGCVLTMALNFGFVAQMVDTAISTELGDLQIHATGYTDDPALERVIPLGTEAVAALLASEPDVAGFAPRVLAQGLVNSPRASVGVRVIGVDPAREPGVTQIRDLRTRGEWLPAAGRRVFVGEALARRLQVDVGDKVVLSAQDRAGDLTGQAYRVAGLFRSASRGLDQGTLFLPLSEGQSLLGLGDGVNEVLISARDRERLPRLRDALAQSLGDPVDVQTWQEAQPLLVYMIESFDAQAWIVYAAVFVAMAFGIANVLLMAVHERTREIGMLRAVGMSRRRVVGLVVGESLVVTFGGLLVGFGLALLCVWSLRAGIDLSAFAEGLNAYGIGTRLVPVLRPSDVWIPLVVGAVASFLASLWPAWRAARLDPADALRRL
ncbi:MAG: ABC transporter permease [Proteobacteria bacterium]|nr:ABC transporter permease [Pseudomonadota bacterium]